MSNLLDFLRKYHHWLLFVFLEVVSAVLLFKFNSYQGSVWLSSANVAVGKMYEMESGVTSFFSMTRANEELTLRNFYLERQVDQLRRLYTEMTHDTTVIERQELQFLSKYKLIPAKVVANTVNKPDNLMTIDKGAADGVEVNMGVASGNGIVGVVYLVSEHYAIVIPALNTTMSRKQLCDTVSRLARCMMRRCLRPLRNEEISLQTRRRNYYGSRNSNKGKA